MKKLLLLALATISFTQVHAQTGTWLVYGNGSFSQTSNSNNSLSTQGNNTNWSVAPGIGYQFNKHLTVGIQGSYTHTENSAPVYYPFSSSYIPYYYGGGITIDWSAGAFFRYTQRVGKIFFLYGQANMSYISTELYNTPYYYTNNGGYVTESYPKQTGFQAQLFPAVGARVYKGLALNFSFGGINYTTQSQNVDGVGSNKSSNIAVTFGQQVNFGISDNFNCHMMHHHKHHHTEAGAELHKADMNVADDDDAPAPVTTKHKKHKKEKKDDGDE